MLPIIITSEVNKLLVPTPDTIDTNPMNYIYDFHSGLRFSNYKQKFVKYVSEHVNGAK